MEQLRLAMSVCVCTGLDFFGRGNSLARENPGVVRPENSWSYFLSLFLAARSEVCDDYSLCLCVCLCLAEPDLLVSISSSLWSVVLCVSHYY